MLVRMWKSGSFTHCWEECKLMWLLWKTVWQYLKRLSRVTKWPSNYTARYMPMRNENICPHKYLYVTSSIHRSIIHKCYSYPNVPQLINEMCYRYTTEYFLATEKYWFMLHVEWNLKTWGSVKETSHTGPHNAQCHWCEMFTIGHS